MEKKVQLEVVITVIAPGDNTIEQNKKEIADSIGRGSSIALAAAGAYIEDVQIMVFEGHPCPSNPFNAIEIDKDGDGFICADAVPTVQRGIRDYQLMIAAITEAFSEMSNYDELVQQSTEDEDDSFYGDWTKALFALRDLCQRLPLNSGEDSPSGVLPPTSRELAIATLEAALAGKTCRMSTIGACHAEAPIPCSVCSGYQILKRAKEG